MWHDITLEETIKQLNTDPKTGLTQKEAKERLLKYGRNALPQGKKIPWWLLFLKQFNSPLVIILLAAAGMTAWLKEYTDTSVILAAVIVNTLVGFYQEYRSGNIFEKLRQIVKVQARIIRDKKTFEVDAEEVVPGDIIILKPGMKAPADGRIFQTRHLRMNEAILTGESTPVKKIVGVTEKETPLADQNNMVFMGTTVEEGETIVIVTSTGAKTEVGQIANLTQKAEEVITPLQQRIAGLGKVLTAFVGIAAFLIFVSGLLESRDIVEMFTLAVAVAVAAIPEGLPAALSVVLAVSSQHILKKKGLVKHILAAETLGSATVICSDKTGTLTEGIMKLEKLFTDDADELAMKILALANEAVAERHDNEWQIKGDATDKAKMEFFVNKGGSLEELLEKSPRINFLPFDPTKKYLASFNLGEDKKSTEVFVSGAPEILLGLSSSAWHQNGVLNLTEDKKTELENLYESLAKSGYRVIGCAHAKIQADPKILESQEQPYDYIKDLTFIGLAAIRDPIREDVKETIKITKEAGLGVVMVTGDHRLTAEAIGKELGLNGNPESIMEAKDLDALSDEDLKQKIKGIEIFARVNPKHKMRIIQAWQANGASVAMTGDGINDAPALRAADIGVAVGSATDVTKEAADLVLLDNSFSTIISAIEHGRIAFDNIRKVTILLLITSFTELILSFLALIFKTPLPITATQILWANLVQDALPSLSLAFEKGESDIMKRQPIKRSEPIIDKEGWLMIFIAGIISDLILGGVFMYLHFFTNIPTINVQTFIFAVLSINILFYIFSIKSLRQPITKTKLFNNPFVLAAVAFGLLMVFGAIYHPALNTLLKTAPLPLMSLLAVIGLSLLKVIIIEIIKWRFRKNST
ncbi:HAD family hydrolase [Candidatus Parcubacteria bacterium]|nr:MAG: HAD family hydrolase [Candidatus Parcubacteria bacterium]